MKYSRCCVISVVMGFVIASASLHAQALEGSVFAGAGAFLCCDTKAAAWQLGAGIDVPLSSFFWVGGELSVAGPVGDGVVFERLGPNAFAYNQFGLNAYILLRSSIRFARSDARVKPFVGAGVGGPWADEPFPLGLNI